MFARLVGTILTIALLCAVYGVLFSMLKFTGLLPDWNAVIGVTLCTAVYSYGVACAVTRK